jgi:demethylmenaquinone methyltransferase / 2-methoxy-6-polyprenyl-1,4-benzoquinol methylase
MPEATAVNRFFSAIAPGYDLANRVMSSGVDVLWRHHLAKRARISLPEDALDLATGSGDVAFTLAKKVPSLKRITGLDFCQPMLEVARSKLKKRPLPIAISFEQGDCLSLPYADESFDLVTIAFGLRNLEDRHLGLKEMLRVLRPGGKLLVLEFTQPDRWIRGPYYWYLKNIIPRISGALTGNADAYHYLSSSIEGFPTQEAIADELKVAGFHPVTHRGLTCSIAAVHEGQKAP